MKKYRIVCKRTGREIASVNVPMQSYVNNLVIYVLKYVAEYCDTGGMVRIHGINYDVDDLIVLILSFFHRKEVGNICEFLKQL